MLLPIKAEPANHTLGGLEHTVNDLRTIQDPLNRPNSSKWHVQIRTHAFAELHTYHTVCWFSTMRRHHRLFSRCALLAYRTLSAVRTPSTTPRLPKIPGTVLIRASETSHNISSLKVLISKMTKYSKDREMTRYAGSALCGHSIGPPCAYRETSIPYAWRAHDHCDSEAF